jgi:hypothetical protein
VKTIRRYLPLLMLPVLCTRFASAQSQVDFNAGVGMMADKSSNERFSEGGSVYRTPSLNSVFMGLGGALMLNKKVGVGAEVSFQPNKPDYAFLNARNMFYDFHGIYQPFSAKRAALQLKAGVGGTNTRFYYSGSECNGFLGCSNYSQVAGSANHFQVRAGVGVQVYLTDRVFIRPAIDMRYVPNFQQYGSNWVPSGMVWVGYSIGDR